MVRTAFLMALAGCGTAHLDAGSDRPHGQLPVDERNPIIIANDGARDNWQGEYAVTFASAGQLVLVGIIVNTSPEYPSVDTNMQGWRSMVDAARSSNMQNIPDPTASPNPPLQRPADGNIESTAANRSPGAELIVETAHRLSQPHRPLVVATGGKLTDVADAYLIDKTVADSVVVVASLGHPSADGQGALMNDPNGGLDAWADEIVVKRFRYVQVNAYYPQREDVPATRIAELPANPFGAWMNSKLGDILELHEAADQNSVIASAFARFAIDVEQMSVTGSTTTVPIGVPVLGSTDDGRAWLVRRGDNAGATDRFWQALKDPATFGR